MEMPVIDYKDGNLGFYDLNNYSQSELINIGVSGVTQPINYMKLLGVNIPILQNAGNEVIKYGIEESINKIEK